MEKIDWRLLRSQLIAIEEERNFKEAIFGSFASEPVWKTGQSHEEFAKIFTEYQGSEVKIFNHLCALIDGGYIVGVMILKCINDFHYALTRPRLTPCGKDLLNAIRGAGLLEEIEIIAGLKGIEMSFDNIHGLSELALLSFTKN